MVIYELLMLVRRMRERIVCIFATHYIKLQLISCSPKPIQSKFSGSKIGAFPSKTLFILKRN